jgi:hypothetical protein
MQKNWDKTGEFLPIDFAFVIDKLPDGCPVVGGQAVSWWAQRFGITTEDGLPVTSSDIDFWGDRNDLMLLASRLNLKPIFPHDYEMTVWAGAIQIVIQEKLSLAEFLHTVPGLDYGNPDKVSAEQLYLAPPVTRKIQFLTPISLIHVKLHCLRAFPQEHRDDETHLRVSFKTARSFLVETLNSGELRQMFWNIERLIAAHHFKPYRRLEKSIGFNILDAVPIADLRAASTANRLSPENKDRLSRFLENRWAKVQDDPEPDENEISQ